MLSVSSAVIGKGPPQRKGNHERNHFLFSLFLKHGVLLGHLEEEEEGALLSGHSPWAWPC